MSYLARLELYEEVSKKNSLDLNERQTLAVRGIIKFRKPTRLEKIIPAGPGITRYIVFVPGESGEMMKFEIRGSKVFSCGKLLGILEDPNAHKVLDEMLVGTKAESTFLRDASKLVKSNIDRKG